MFTVVGWSTEQAVRPHQLSGEPRETHRGRAPLSQADSTIRVPLRTGVTQCMLKLGNGVAEARRSGVAERRASSAVK